MADNKEFFSEEIENRMHDFQFEQAVFTKGKLSFVIQFTRMVKDKEFPLSDDDFQTNSKGQVSGISGSNVKKILSEHGITRQLSAEGGRTNRGSLGLMMAYVHFLNQLHQEGNARFNEIENFWAEEVRKYFAGKPFVLSSDTSKTIRANLDDLFEQAKKRERQNKGSRYLGVMLQHLVGAKLKVILPKEDVEIHGASVADSPTDRAGDFVVNNTIIHCTTMPGELLIEKCKNNLQSGAKPIIITIYERVHTAINLLEDNGLSGRVEVWDIQQFLSSNVMEHSAFQDGARNSSLADIIEQYNDIIDSVESDPSLKIEFNK